MDSKNNTKIVWIGNVCKYCTLQYIKTFVKNDK